MIRSEFEEFVHQALDADTKERLVKGDDYARPDEDGLSNFKEVATELGITPMQVWGVYFLKGVKAITRFARDGRVSSESINGRFTDARNYLLLGQALLKEERDLVEMLSFIQEQHNKREERAEAQVAMKPAEQLPKMDKFLSMLGLAPK